MELSKKLTYIIVNFPYEDIRTKNLMLKKQIMNFILVGIINTIVGYSLYVFFIYLGFHYSIAVLFATILGVFFNFKTIGKLVFRESNNTSIVKFFGVYIVIFITNVTLIKVFVSFGYNDYVSGLFAIFPCAMISFVLNKFYVFRS
jgi:putative flippase GtrA